MDNFFFSHHSLAGLPWCVPDTTLSAENTKLTYSLFCFVFISRNLVVPFFFFPRTKGCISVLGSEIGFDGGTNTTPSPRLRDGINREEADPAEQVVKRAPS